MSLCLLFHSDLVQWTDLLNLGEGIGHLCVLSDGNLLGGQLRTWFV